MCLGAWAGRRASVWRDSDGQAPLIGLRLGPLTPISREALVRIAQAARPRVAHRLLFANAAAELGERIICKSLLPLGLRQCGLGDQAPNHAAPRRHVLEHRPHVLSDAM